MCSYVRVIKRGRWPSEEEIKKEINIDNIQARTIVQEMTMKGEQSCLSIWKLNVEKDIALALISPNKNSLEKITILKIDEKILTENGLTISQEEGESVVQGLNNKHYDIINMTYKNLGDFANVIITALKNDKNVLTISKRDIATYVNEAIKNKEIDINDLDENFLRKVKEMTK